VSVDGLRQFRQSWTDSPLYATKNLERMRPFFRFCHQAGWIKENPEKGGEASQGYADADAAVLSRRDEAHRVKYVEPRLLARAMLSAPSKALWLAFVRSVALRIFLIVVTSTPQRGFPRFPLLVLLM
jgi:hypothetical protein